MECFSPELCVRSNTSVKTYRGQCWGTTESQPCRFIFAVIEVKIGITVGHMLWKVFLVFSSLFLCTNGMINVCTTERSYFSTIFPRGDFTHLKAPARGYKGSNEKTGHSCSVDCMYLPPPPNGKV